MLYITIITSVLLLAGSCAVFVDPGIFWPVAFCGLFYPVWLLFSIFLFIYWLIKRKFIAIIPLLCILVGLYHIPNCIGLKNLFSTVSETQTTNRLRILSWNVRYFQPVKENNKHGRRAMLNIIRDIQPDVICIQEYYNRTNANENLDDSITHILKYNHYYFKPLKRSFSGMAIFSKYPIHDTGFIKLSPIKKSNQCIFADIVIKGKTLRIYNVHLRSSNLPQKFTKEFKKYNGITGRIRKYWAVIKRLKQAFIYRSTQVKIMKTYMQASPYPYILAGDFNDPPVSYTYHQLSGGLKNTFTEKGSGIGKTHWAGYPAVQIDYILVNPAFNVLKYKVISTQLSDHYPVYADIAW